MTIYTVYFTLSFVEETIVEALFLIPMLPVQFMVMKIHITSEVFAGVIMPRLQIAILLLL